MAVYTVTLRADKLRCPKLLCNGNLVAEGRSTTAATSPPGTTRIRSRRTCSRWWAPIWHAASSVCTRAGKDHLLQVYVRRGDMDKTEHAMNSLMASIAWDEARFGLSLDLERFMIVAVDDFNMGAMENKA